MEGNSTRNWSAWRRSNFSFFERKLSAHPVTSTLVDLGAGPLQFKSIFRRFHYTGVDFEKYPDVSIVTDLTKELPIESSSVDIVTLSNTLEHIPYPLPVLKEAFRILKPGGHIVGTVPFLMQVHQAPYDFNRYTYFQLDRALSDAGFTDISVEPLGNLIDVYNSMELKFFDHASKDGGPLFRILRAWRRAEMRVLRWLIRTKSVPKYTEGYGFSAIK